MTNDSLRLTAAMVDEAFEAIRPHLPATPLIEAPEARRPRVFLKCETAQPTGSFKVRGALSNLVRLPRSEAGFVTASAGNHGLGVAWAARQCERPETVTIFVPSSAPDKKIQKLRQFAVSLKVVPGTFDDAERAAHQHERETGARFIHAFDDRLTAAGQGTMAIEIGESLGAVGTLIVPVGGGGLISGNAAWFKERRPSTRIVAVQPEASPALSESIRVGKALLEFPAGPTLADGLAGGIGKVAFEHRDLIDEVVNVPEDRILEAIRELYRGAGLRAEASAAISLAAARLPSAESWPDPIVCILTGANIDDVVFKTVVGE